MRTSLHCGVVGDPTVWACPELGGVVLSGTNIGEDEYVDAGTAERLAAAAAAGVLVARLGPTDPVPNSPQWLLLAHGIGVQLPAPDPDDPSEDLAGYVHFGSGMVAAYPGDGVVHVVGLGGEASDADDVEAWALSVLRAVRLSRLRRTAA
jgi:hypothetical protein